MICPHFGILIGLNDTNRLCNKASQFLNKLIDNIGWHHSCFVGNLSLANCGFVAGKQQPELQAGGMMKSLPIVCSASPWTVRFMRTNPLRSISSKSMFPSTHQLRGMGINTLNFGDYSTQHDLIMLLYYNCTFIIRSITTLILSIQWCNSIRVPTVFYTVTTTCAETLWQCFLMISFLCSRAVATGQNTIIPDSLLEAFQTATICFYKGIADYLELGKGIWFKRHGNVTEFLDGFNEPASHPQGPRKTHYR